MENTIFRTTSIILEKNELNVNKTRLKFGEMLELDLEKVPVRTNERDVSYFVLNFGGVFYEGPGTTQNEAKCLRFNLLEASKPQ